MDEAMKIQMQVRENAYEMQKRFDDMNAFLEEIKVKEQKLFDDARVNIIDELMDRIPECRPDNMPKQRGKKPGSDRQKHANQTLPKSKKYVSPPGSLSATTYASILMTGTKFDDFNCHDAKMLMDYGDMCFKIGKWKAAISAYTDCLQFESSKKLLLYGNRAVCHIMLEIFAMAEVDCQCACQIEPFNVQIKMRRGVTRQRHGDIDTAVNDFRCVILSSSFRQETFEEMMNLIKLCASDKAADQSIQSLGDSEKETGNDLFKEDMYEEAAYQYTLALSINPGDPTYFANRAMCKLKLHKEDEAELDCSAAIVLKPSYSKAYYRRATAKKIKGNLQGAVNDLRTYLKLQPNNVEAIKELSNVSAELLYKKTADDDEDTSSDMPAENIDRVNALMKKNKWNKAKKLLKSLLLDSDDFRLYHKRAKCFIALKKYDLGLEDCNKAIQLQNNNPALFITRALIRKELGDLQGTRLDYQEAFRLRPEDPLVKAQLETLNTMLRNDITITSRSDYLPNDDKPEDMANFEKVSFVRKPPHQRSKAPLREVNVEEIVKMSRAEVIQKLTSADPRKIKLIPEKTGEYVHGSEGENAENDCNDSEYSLEEMVKTYDELLSYRKLSAGMEQLNKANNDSAVKTVPPPPQTYIELVDGWQATSKSNELRAKYISQIPPTEIPHIIRNALSGDILSEFLEELYRNRESDQIDVYPYLEALREVKRFKSLCMFLTEETRNSVSHTIKICVERGRCSEEDADILRSEYGLGTS